MKLRQEKVSFILRLLFRARLIAAVTVFTVFTITTDITYRIWLATWLRLRGGSTGKSISFSMSSTRSAFLDP